MPATFGQGRVIFNNLSSTNGVTLGDWASGGSGQPSVFLGSSYSIQLLWLPGTYTDMQTFWAANPSTSTPIAFFGTTGTAPNHGPTIDGAGLYDGGIVAMGGPGGLYTMQARLWYNNGIFSTFAAAQAGSVNYGWTELIQVNVNESPAVAVKPTFSNYTIPIIPEPSAPAQMVLGAAGWVMLRGGRRK